MITALIISLYSVLVCKKRFHFSDTYRLNCKSDVGVNCPFKCLYSPRYKTAPVINFSFYLQASTHMKKR